MENEGDIKITVRDWLDFLNSQKELFLKSIAFDEGLAISSGTLLIASVVSLTQGFIHWILGILGSLVALYLVVSSIRGGWVKFKCVGELIVLQCEILNGELKEVKEISEKYFSSQLLVTQNHNRDPDQEVKENK